MGTLKEQPVRRTLNITEKQHVNFVEEISRVASETGVSIENVLKAREVMELSRRNDLFVANGDIHDEQMSGFGDLLENLTIDNINYLIKQGFKVKLESYNND
jgi:hypothetical protein